MSDLAKKEAFCPLAALRLTPEGIWAEMNADRIVA